MLLLAVTTWRSGYCIAMGPSSTHARSRILEQINQFPKCIGGDTSGGDVQVWVVSDGGWWLPRTYTLARGGAGCGWHRGPPLGATQPCEARDWWHSNCSQYLNFPLQSVAVRGESVLRRATLLIIPNKYQMWKTGKRNERHGMAEKRRFWTW